MSPRHTSPDYDALPTERANEALRDLDLRAAPELVAAIHAEDHRALEAVGRAAAQIAELADRVGTSLRLGGRLIYLGAGTSGRLAAADAAECPPTFGTRPGQVVALVAGGRPALHRAVEGAEDSRSSARQGVRRLAVDARDTVCGISASGVTPFVLAGLDEARRRGAATALVTCAEEVQVQGRADLLVRLDVGPEAVSGSTRMKAGLATKAVLHAVSTVAMIRLGKVYDNLMVDLRPTSRKLRRRAQRIVGRLTGLSPARAQRLLGAAGGSPKVAAVMFHRGLDAVRARHVLAAHGGDLRAVIGAPRGR